MAEVSRSTAKGYFNTGDTPTESNFSDLLDSIPFTEEAKAYADYYVEKISTTYYARPRTGSGLTAYSGSALATVLQNAVNALTPSGAATTGGGRIHVTKGVHTLSDEVTISGWESGGDSYSAIEITGEGFATRFFVNGASKSGFICHNRANVVLRNFSMTVGATSVSGIRLLGNGTSERSINKGIIDNVWILASGTGPGFYATNFFNLNCPWLRVDCTTNDGVVLEGTSTSLYYGNSNFGYLQANAPNTTGSYAGLRITTAAGVGVKALNLISIQGLYAVGTYGYVNSGGRFISVSFADIEYCKYPITISGAAVSNSILSGYFYSDKTDGRVINVSDTASDSNRITGYVQTDFAATELLYDISTAAGNDFDLTLSPDADETKISITSPHVTRVRIRRKDNNLVMDSHGGPVYKFLTADVANSTTSYADITGLSFPVKSGSTYRFKFYIGLTSAASTTGAGLALAFPDNPTKISYTTWLPTTNGTMVPWVGYTGEDAPAAAQTTFPGNLSGASWIEGIIKPSVDGDVQARMMSEVAASAVTAKADISYVEYQLIR